MPTYREVRLSGLLPETGNTLEISSIALYSLDGSTRLEASAISIESTLTLTSGTLSTLLSGSTAASCVFDVTNSLRDVHAITIKWSSDVEVGYFAFGSGDDISKGVRYAKLEYKDITKGTWYQVGLSALRGNAIMSTYPGPHAMQSLISGPSGGVKYFDNDKVGNPYTVNADGKIFSAVGGQYHSVSSARPFVKGAIYYFEYEMTNAIVGFVIQANYYEAAPYVGSGPGPNGWSLGAAGSPVYMNRMNATGATSFSTGMSGLAANQRVGVTLNMTTTDMVCTYRISPTQVFSFNINPSMNASVGNELYLAFCADTPGAARSVKFFTEPGDMLYAPQSTPAVYGMPQSAPLSAISNYNGLAYLRSAANDILPFPLETVVADQLKTRLPDTDIIRIPQLNTGWGYIKSTVHIQATPNIPVSRRVLLMHPSNDTAVRETVSDPITGLYEFKNLDEGFAYHIFVQDNSGVYQPAAAGPVRPTRMPGTVGMPKLG